MWLESSRSVVILALAGLSSACVLREGAGDDELAETGTSGASEGGSAATQTMTNGAEEGSSGPNIPPTTGWDETGGWDEYGEATGEPTTGGPRDCEDPVDLVQFDGVTPNGFEQCADGFIQKTVDAECLLPPAPESCATGQGDECGTSAECDEFPDGACIDRPGVLEGCGCVYACRRHEDCAESSVCLCTGIEGIDWPICSPVSECDDPVDCVCGLDVRQQGCGEYEYELACWWPASECRVECEPEPTCAGEVEVPPCEIVGGLWICNEESVELCGDCGCRARCGSMRA